ncbi:MAG: hypothetical protein ABI901_16140 [Roseiflexaceae bacterium]
MIQSNQGAPLYRVRMLPKDLGVAIVVLVALLLGLGMRYQVEGRVKQFQDANSPFRMSYPAAWGFADSLQDVLLKVEDPNTGSTFKTTMSVESRELDPASPPTIQTLIDRRVEQRSGLTGYHFLSNGDTTVGGAKSALIEYAYIVQPNDEPRRASLPVVVQAREYIIIGKDRTYYVTLNAPENAFAEASAQFERMIKTVQLQ